MKTVLALIAVLAVAGCVSAPPGARAGWSVSLVSIQLGGSQTTVDTQNNLVGTNVTQRHTLGDAAVSDPTTVSLPPVTSYVAP